MPARTLTTEFFVGFFVLIGILTGGYLSIGLGELNVFGGAEYSVTAEFDNIAGLKEGASVEVAGVKIGRVVQIILDSSGNYALVKMQIDKQQSLREDDVAQIRTKGIIGDRYVKISRGSSDKILADGAKMPESESVVDFEDLIGKIIHNFEGKNDEEK
jgi:phospholipid/cholesterol/gamma-HCH transport system substrate-binding protein